VPERLKRLNYLFMRNSEEELAAIPDLVRALSVDIEWVWLLWNDAPGVGI